MADAVAIGPPPIMDVAEKEAQRRSIKRAQSREAQRRYRARHRRIEYHPTRRAMAKIENYKELIGANLLGERLSLSEIINEMIESWRRRG